MLSKIGARMKAKEGFGWILERVEGKKRIAHLAVFGPCATQFLPVFPTRRHALEYRDERLKMPHLKTKRITIGLKHEV